MNRSQLFISCLVVGLVGACGVTAEVAETDDPGLLGRSESRVIVGTVDWSSASALTGTKAQVAEAVGYLWIPAKGDRCTAWLASPDIVITNSHCIDTDSEAAGARVAFNYYDNEDGSPSSQFWYTCSKLVKTWRELDMTALRCAPRNNQLPGHVQGYLRVASTDAAQGAGIYVIHQNCDSYTDPDCKNTKKYSPGSILKAIYKSTDTSYNADTLGGSSGAPVLSEDRHEVVALHHLAWNPTGNGRGSHNSGVRASLIGTALRDIGIGCSADAGTPCP